MNALAQEQAEQDASFAEMRAAPRFSLMMRSAKLLCESGEYVCVVRDISATGTKLRLFHEPPPDTHLFLELGNGDRYAMERMWHRDDHAGFRFASSIDVGEFMEERGPHPRRPIRLRLERPALVMADGVEREAALVNLSQQGACIEAARQLAVGQTLRLEVAGLPLRFGHVCWRRGGTHGLVFQQAFRLDELAQYAVALQPFVPAPAEQTAGAGQRAA